MIHVVLCLAVATTLPLKYRLLDTLQGLTSLILARESGKRVVSELLALSPFNRLQIGLGRIICVLGLPRVLATFSVSSCLS